PIDIYTLSYTTLFRSSQFPAGPFPALDLAQSSDRLVLLNEMRVLIRFQDKAHQMKRRAGPVRGIEKQVRNIAPTEREPAKSLNQDRKSTRLNSSYVKI